MPTPYVPAPARAGLLALLPALAALALGCAGTHPPAEVRETLRRAVDAAEAHRREGRPAEAYPLVDAALAVDPDHAAALDLRASLPGGAAEIYERPVLGSNVARRPATERSIPAEILLYLPDRVLDLLDLVSFDVHVGPGLYANLHATRALQLGAGLRSTAGLGWHDHRSLGLLARSESGLALGPLGAQTYAGTLVGTSGVRSTADGLAPLYGPGDAVYQELQDYWAVGSSVTLGLVGVDLELHPVELVDLLLGLAAVDLLHDDFAATRGLDLSDEEERLLERLGAYRRSDETMERLREAEDEAAGAGG